MPPEYKENIAELIRNLGFPVVAACGLGWVGYIQMESFGTRFDRLLDHQVATTDSAIERGNVAMERANVVIGGLQKTLEDNITSRKEFSDVIKQLGQVIEREKDKNAPAK